MFEDIELLVAMTCAGGVLFGCIFIGMMWRTSAMAEPKPPEPGMCLKCGYDLRATPDRCPECGELNYAETPAR